MKREERMQGRRDGEAVGRRYSDEVPPRGRTMDERKRDARTSLDENDNSLMTLTRSDDVTDSDVITDSDGTDHGS